MTVITGPGLYRQRGGLKVRVLVEGSAGMRRAVARLGARQ